MKRDAAARAIIRNNLQFRVVDPDQKIDIFVSPGTFCIGPLTFLRQRHPSGRIDVIAPYVKPPRSDEPISVVEKVRFA